MHYDYYDTRGYFFDFFWCPPTPLKWVSIDWSRRDRIESDGFGPYTSISAILTRRLACPDLTYKTTYSEVALQKTLR